MADSRIFHPRAERYGDFLLLSFANASILSMKQSDFLTLQFQPLWI